jgi:hypothetical protein
MAYLEVLVAIGRKMDTLRGTITACATLLQRYADRHPGATDLRDLAADDIDAYLADPHGDRMVRSTSGWRVQRKPKPHALCVSWRHGGTPATP